MAERKEIQSRVETEFQAVLADAAKLYKKSSGKNIGDFMAPPMSSIDDLKKQLDDHNDSFSAFRSKRKTLFDTLTAMLQPVEVLGEIVASAAGEVFPASQNVYSAVLFLINAAHDVSSMYDSILELFDELKVCLESIPQRGLSLP